MPHITIMLEDRHGEDVRVVLARTITDVFVKSLGSRPEWISIAFEVHPRHLLAIGGTLLSRSADTGSRPFVTVKFHKGRPAEKKRLVASRITDAMVAAIGGEPDDITVVFDDYAQEDWAIGGALQLDRHGPVPPPDPV